MTDTMKYILILLIGLSIGGIVGSLVRAGLLPVWMLFVAWIPMSFMVDYSAWGEESLTALLIDKIKRHRSGGGDQ